MNTPHMISICICTFQRESVVQTLESIAQMTPVENTVVRVVVADNDENPSAQILVRQTAEGLGLTLRYVHAPARNISIARNACLDSVEAGLLAFVDDDEMVGERWLTAMLRKAEETDAAVILGPVKALYDARDPAWMVRGDFHSTRPVDVNGTITTGYAGNVLMRWDNAILRALRFDETLGVIGGEDTDFFGRAHALGARIAYAPEAIAYEPVPPQRANAQWLLARHRRFGETHAQMLLRAGKSPKKERLRALAKAAICVAVLPLHLFDRSRWMRWRLRAAMHYSVAQSLVATQEAP